MEFMNSTNTKTILQKVGKIVEMEESIINGRILRNFMRAKMEVDVTKPLPSGCWVPRKYLPKIWVIYKYERLQDLCYNCGVLGLEQRLCKVPRVMSSYCSSIPKYDQHLSTPTPRFITTILKEHKRICGDSTKYTAQKFFRNNSQENKKKEPEENDEEANRLAKEKAKKEWEELIANCGEVFYVSSMGRKYKPLQIREDAERERQNKAYLEPLEETSTSEEVTYPMPPDTFMTDEELAAFRSREHFVEGETSRSVNEKKASNRSSVQDESTKDYIEGNSPSVQATLQWREPPKTLPKADSEYVVEFFS